MESIVKKLQKKFKDAKYEMLRWEKLQSRLVSQLSNAFAIIQRLELVQDIRNFGALRCVEDIQEAVLDKEMESFQNIQISIDRTMDEFAEIISSVQKIVRDGHHIIRVGGSPRLTEKQLKQRIGVKPTLEDCLNGLTRLEEMYQSEYRLKQKIVSALPVLVLKASERKSIPDLQRFLVEQPNILQDEGKKCV